MLEIIPVMDLMSGMAVSGKSGKRDTYKPLETIYSKTPDPVDIAIALKRVGFKRVYVADLDAIEGKGSNLEQVKRINHILPVMLDWGVLDFKGFQFTLGYARQIILATETMNSWKEIEEIITTFPKERTIISIDVKDGEILSKNMSLTFSDIKKSIKILNPHEIILLDISGVGTQQGYNEELLDYFDGFKNSLILGGGLRSSDINQLKEKGISKFLVGTALHLDSLKLSDWR